MIIVLIHIFLVVPTIIRLFLRDNLAPDVRLAWVFVVILFPIFGCILYGLFGEHNLGKHGTHCFEQATNRVMSEVKDCTAVLGTPEQIMTVPLRYRAAFAYLQSINGFFPLSGNHAELMPDGKTARYRMIADIDAAQSEVCVLYYIWLDDNTGREMAEALIRAVNRGIRCYVMVDGLGSRAFLKSESWSKMCAAGVQTRVALSLEHPLRVLLCSRIDLRNHRKITLIDGKITYCGSQNCADEAFLIKAKFAPWVDIMMRFSGSIAAQMRLLFTADWMMAGGNILPNLQSVEPISAENHTMLAQVMGGGPAERARATPQFLVSLISSAEKSLVLSTPYFVPDATVLNALCTTALRGVSVTLIVPARNDSWIVAAASRSHYHLLLESGVKIYEFEGGLLHAKTLTLDGCITLIGSTNLDLRSFDLNFENNILFYDTQQTIAVWQRQQDYCQRSREITLTEVLTWSIPKRMWHNLIATVSPVL